jgi:uncharacterized protein DUF6719
MRDRKTVSCALAVVTVLAVAMPLQAEVLKREPAMGAPREGQVVLVDDGSCPAGQLKQVTGGNHVKAGGTKHIERSYKCVPK